MNGDEPQTKPADLPTPLTGRKDITMTTRFKNTLTQTMIFTLLLICSIPAWGNPLHDAAGKGDIAIVKLLKAAKK